MTADSLGISVVAGPVEATALGNIILQLIALGDIKDIDEGRAVIRAQESVRQNGKMHIKNSVKQYRNNLEVNFYELS